LYEQDKKMGGGGHHHVNKEAIPREDQDIKALKDAQIPLAWRDTCGHLLVKLNKCRRQTYYSPHECTHERHTFEECEYNAYLQRVEAKKYIREMEKTAQQV
jgi:NADH dehydrogenase (ubiquinone) 1 beta subcomplex subunit 7